jgi:uncharacterized protein
MRLFDWDATEQPMPRGSGTHTLLWKEGEVLAGVHQLGGPGSEGVPAHWMTYAAVDDVDAAARHALELGGKLPAPPMDVPGAGRMALVQDPTGAAIAIAQFVEFGTSPHGPFGWSELATRDIAAAADFYRALLGWTSQTDAKSGYTHFQLGGTSVAGMISLPPQQVHIPPHWLPYIAVADCAAIAEKAPELEGVLHLPPTAIEQVGCFSVLADPAGAAFGIMQLYRP